MCHTTPAPGPGVDAQPEIDCDHMQVRKRQSTAEQQQRAAKQQRDKKVQRRDAESMQDDQDVSGDNMTAPCTPNLADLRNCCSEFMHRDQRISWPSIAGGRALKCLGMSLNHAMDPACRLRAAYKANAVSTDSRTCTKNSDMACRT